MWTGVAYFAVMGLIGWVVATVDLEPDRHVDASGERQR